MPSGFQQDQNQLTPSYYRITITMTGGSATWTPVGDGNEFGTNEGRISTYAWDNFEGDNRPTTQATANALARGNLRFQAIVESLSNLADCQILDIEEQANPNGDDMANNEFVNFTVKFDRDEGVFPALCAIKKAQNWGSEGTTPYDNVVYPAYYTYHLNGDDQDNNAGGDTVNNTNDAIRDVIWKALYDGRTRSVRVFQPVDGSDPFTGEGIQAIITADKPWNNDNNAYADITCEEIDGTTTTIITD
jgi:hypothetical protein